MALEYVEELELAMVRDVDVVVLVAFFLASLLCRLRF